MSMRLVASSCKFSRERASATKSSNFFHVQHARAVLEEALGYVMLPVKAQHARF